jgi:hypothetical protein
MRTSYQTVSYKILATFSPMRATHLSPPVFREFITNNEASEHKFSRVSCYFILLSSKYSPQCLLEDRLCSSLNVTGQVSRPFKQQETPQFSTH